MGEDGLKDAPEACATGKIRLYVPEAALAAGAEAALTPGQAHYLQNVMRRTPGDPVRLFNGRDGEWRAQITHLAKRGGAARAERQTRAQDAVPDLWLLFAPVKRAPLDFLVQKATELGIAGLGAVLTRRTHVSRVKEERLAANALEAAEQCGRLTVPEIFPTRPLEDVLAHWPPDRTLLFCDEAGAPPALEALGALPRGPAAVLIGPEGGFDADERARLRAKPFVAPMSLGPRILRADTAGIAALTLFQAVLGDLRKAPA